MTNSNRGVGNLFSLASLFALTACSGAIEDPNSGDHSGDSPPQPPEPPLASTISLPDPETIAFLTQATFGPTEALLEALKHSSQSEWVVAQFEEPPTYHLPNVLATLPDGDIWDLNGNYVPRAINYAVASFWEAAIVGEDQLRQRMAFALSQILVASGGIGSPLQAEPHTQAAYMDILVRHAFGNYRDLLGEVTYSVAMSQYLTYLQNTKGDPENGRVPDENYARELMQLFTIGLVELNPDGTSKLSGGKPIETYTNEDIIGLARVFTGLSYDEEEFWQLREQRDPDAHYTPLKMFPEWHSALEKAFLGTTVPPNTSGAISIDLALDRLFNHPNVGPFIGRQLIQRFVTSNPKPDYVARVTLAFDTGAFALPDGTVVGEGRRGDLKATIAAILFDAEARDSDRRNAPDFGKLREPALRLTHWARAFDVNSADASAPWSLYYSGGATSLSQHPFHAPSVFNFYRPGYVPPGTEAEALSLVAPEFQLVNSVSVIGYANFMSRFIFEYESGANEASPPTFQPDYADEIALAHEPVALVAHLNAFLTNNHLTETSKKRISSILKDLPVRAETKDEDLKRRAELAVLLVMTSPEYLIQR